MLKKRVLATSLLQFAARIMTYSDCVSVPWNHKGHMHKTRVQITYAYRNIIHDHDRHRTICCAVQPMVPLVTLTLVLQPVTGMNGVLLCITLGCYWLRLVVLRMVTVLGSSELSCTGYRRANGHEQRTHKSIHNLMTSFYNVTVIYPEITLLSMISKTSAIIHTVKSPI